MNNYKSLKLGIYLCSRKNNPHLGGSTFFNLLIKALDNKLSNTKNEILLICDDIEDAKSLFVENLSVIQVPKSFNYFINNNSTPTIVKIWRLLTRMYCFVHSKMVSLGVFDSSSFKVKQESIFENLIDDNHIDLMIYANQFSLPTINRPYIWILWDLACRNINFFYKMEQSNALLGKLRFSSSNAFRIITANESGLKDIAKYLIFPEDRIRCIPFPVPDDLIFANEVEPTVRYSNYILYPALLTYHKNHYVILRALKILHQKGIELHLVLTGANWGALTHILNVVNDLELKNFMHYLGVVPIGELKWLYKHAEALVFPAFLGPNNFPPIEAMSLGTPTIVSDIEGHKQQLGENALYFDPRCPKSLAHKINLLASNNECRENIIRSGKMFVKNLTSQDYVTKLSEIAEEFIPYRNTYR